MTTIIDMVPVVEATHGDQRPGRDYVDFSLNSIKLRRQKDQLPMSLDALLDLTRIIPGKTVLPKGPEDANIVACRQGPDGPPEYDALRSNESIAAFWSTCGPDSKVTIDVNQKFSPESPKYTKVSFFSIFGFVLAVFTGSSFGLLPSDMLVAIKSMKGVVGNLGKWSSDRNAALEQMTDYAAATVLAAKGTDDTYLSTLHLTGVLIFCYRNLLFCSDLLSLKLT